MHELAFFFGSAPCGCRSLASFLWVSDLRLPGILPRLLSTFWLCCKAKAKSILEKNFFLKAVVPSSRFGEQGKKAWKGVKGSTVALTHLYKSVLILIWKVRPPCKHLRFESQKVMVFSSLSKEKDGWTIYGWKGSGIVVCSLWVIAIVQPYSIKALIMICPSQSELPLSRRHAVTFGHAGSHFSRRRRDTLALITLF